MSDMPRTDDPEWEKRKGWTLDQLADEVIKACGLRTSCHGTLVGALYDAKRQGRAERGRELALEATKDAAITFYEYLLNNFVGAIPDAGWTPFANSLTRWVVERNEEKE